MRDNIYFEKLKENGIPIQEYNNDIFLELEAALKNAEENAKNDVPVITQSQTELIQLQDDETLLQDVNLIVYYDNLYNEIIKKINICINLLNQELEYDTYKRIRETIYDIEQALDKFQEFRYDYYNKGFSEKILTNPFLKDPNYKNKIIEMFKEIYEKSNIQKKVEELKYDYKFKLNILDKRHLLSPFRRQQSLESLPEEPLIIENEQVFSTQPEEPQQILPLNQDHQVKKIKSLINNSLKLLNQNRLLNQEEINYIQKNLDSINSELLKLENQKNDQYERLNEMYEYLQQRFAIKYGGAPKENEQQSDLIPYPSEQSSDFNDILNKYEFASNSYDGNDTTKNKRSYLYQEPVQLLLRNYISQSTIYDSILLYHGLGVGKCHKRDTPILMYDGSIKMVQDVEVGDLLMGDDSTPRRVMSLAQGEDKMYDIIPTNELGDTYTVNSEHILCLKAPALPKVKNKTVTWIENNKLKSHRFNNLIAARRFCKSVTQEQIIEISVVDYLNLPNSYKELLYGYKQTVEFKYTSVPCDAYILGYMLGHGSTKGHTDVLNYFKYVIEKHGLQIQKSSDLKHLNTKHPYIITGKNNIFNNVIKDYNLEQTKYIPTIFKCNSTEIRFKLLAGIIDSCGEYIQSKKKIRLTQIEKKLMEDIIFVAQSLGFWTKKRLVNGLWNIYIFGNGIYKIPVQIEENKPPVPNVLKQNNLIMKINIFPTRRDTYYGFTLNGNCRYLLGDFTVTHNTCAAITIAEGFKEYVTNLGNKILVIVKNKNIQKNFINELATECTGEEYLTEQKRNLYFGIDGVSKQNIIEARKEIVSSFNKTINKNYQFMTYGTFVNKVLGAKEYEKDEFGRNTTRLKKTADGTVQRKITGVEIKNLNNTVIIIDEAHNITNNDTYIALLKVLQNSYNYRLILLTATPMYDNPREMFELSNLLNANSQELQLPIRNALYKSIDDSDKVLVTKKQSEFINTNVLKGGIIEISQHGLDELSRVLIGKVSYIKPNTETNPIRIDKGNELIPEREGTSKIVYCQMSKDQYLVYLNALKLDVNKDSNLDLSSSIQNIESVENTHEIVSVSKTGSLYKNSSDASTMTYPNGLFGKDGFLSVFKRDKSGKYIINDGMRNIFTTDLMKYSIKLYKLLKTVNESKGNVFIYSNYVSYGGTSLLRQLFLLNGFTEFKAITETGKYNSFVVFDESVTLEIRERYRRIFNSPENKDGKLIKVLIGSPIISEGITLKNVRQVHLLEPSWNMSRINQIIGRAIRNNSHIDLKKEDRKVEVYKYASVFYTKREVEEKYIGDKNNIAKFFIDREKYILSEEKDRSNKIVERMLKENAFDCYFMKERNTKMEKDDIINSAKCDYTKCEYTCKLLPDKKQQIDKSTYNMYISDFDKFDIYYILKTIRSLFEKYFIWSLDDILETILKAEIKISKEAIFTTLNYITENKIIFSDMYNRDGFIVNRGPYYIFNSFDINVNTSFYSKFLDFSVDKTKYTLSDFVKTNLNEDIFALKETKKSKLKAEEIKPEIRDYNDRIVATATIFGTYRKRGTIKDPYGEQDDKFRIVDLRQQPSTSEISKEDDRRKTISGMWIGSYKKPQLLEIVKYLNIQTKVDVEQYDKEQLGKIIQKYLSSNNLVLR